MFSFLKNIFKTQSPVDYQELIKRGAVILDVRSKGEFQSGHIKGSVNVPVNRLNEYVGKLNKDKPVITCCASGARSSAARSMLKSQGFEVYNAGPWTNLRHLK